MQYWHRYGYLKKEGMNRGDRHFDPPVFYREDWRKSPDTSCGSASRLSEVRRLTSPCCTTRLSSGGNGWTTNASLTCSERRISSPARIPRRWRSISASCGQDGEEGQSGCCTCSCDDVTGIVRGFEQAVIVSSSAPSK